MQTVECPNCGHLDIVAQATRQSDKDEADFVREYECICKRCRTMFEYHLILRLPEKGRDVTGHRKAVPK